MGQPVSFLGNDVVARVARRGGSECCNLEWSLEWSSGAQWPSCRAVDLLPPAGRPGRGAGTQLRVFTRTWQGPHGFFWPCRGFSRQVIEIFPSRLKFPTLILQSFFSQPPSNKVDIFGFVANLSYAPIPTSVFPHQNLLNALKMFSRCLANATRAVAATNASASMPAGAAMSR